MEASCRVISLSAANHSHNTNWSAWTHTGPILFTCLAQIRRGALKNSPIVKAAQDSLASVQSRFTPLRVIFSPPLPCWPPTLLPSPSMALASSRWCETGWIIDDVVYWLNWNPGGSIWNAMLLSFVLSPHPKIWKRNPQENTFKGELNISFWSLVKALSCVFLGQNTQRRSKRKITRDRKQTGYVPETCGSMLGYPQTGLMLCDLISYAMP